MANSIFSSAPVEIPNKSGFDMSHSNFFTATCGTLVPCNVDYLLPNDSVSLGVNCQVQLPPMATDFYGNINARFESFFVPNRILYGGWKNVIAPYLTSTGLDTFKYYSAKIPTVSISGGDPFLSVGCLADYLGFGCTNDSDFSINGNIFPFLAYHMIWQHWYSDTRVQRPAFINNLNGGSSLIPAASTLPYVSLPDSNTVSFTLSSPMYGTICLGELRQRLWSKDYFTNATYAPQAGDAASLSFSVGDDTGSFTIAGLRSANALQMFMERNNLAGNDYSDRIRVQYGIRPSDACVNKPIYLGSTTVPVYTKGVFQSADSSTSSSSNPFSTVASKYGSSQGVGSGSLVDSFTATEHGIFMTLFSLVPDCVYSSGTRKQLFNFSDSSDIPYPVLSGIGDEPIYINELVDGDVDSSGGIFGYTQRYASYKYMCDEVHGLLKDGSNLSSFALQRSFGGDVTLSSDFSEIPTDYLDQVCAVSGDISKYGCWVDSYFTYKKVSTLPAYSIPTLENLKNSHIENIPLGGSRL